MGPGTQKPCTAKAAEPRVIFLRLFGEDPTEARALSQQKSRFRFRVFGGSFEGSYKDYYKGSVRVLSGIKGVGGLRVLVHERGERFLEFGEV